MQEQIKELVNQLSKEAYANATSAKEIAKLNEQLTELNEAQRFGFSAERSNQIAELNQNIQQMTDVYNQGIAKYNQIAQENFKQIPELITQQATDDVMNSNVSFSPYGIGTKLGKQAAERQQAKG